MDAVGDFRAQGHTCDTHQHRCSWPMGRGPSELSAVVGDQYRTCLAMIFRGRGQKTPVSSSRVTVGPSPDSFYLPPDARKPVRQQCNLPLNGAPTAGNRTRSSHPLYPELQAYFGRAELECPQPYSPCLPRCPDACCILFDCTLHALQRPSWVCPVSPGEGGVLEEVPKLGGGTGTRRFYLSGGRRGRQFYILGHVSLIPFTVSKSSLCTPPHANHLSHDSFSALYRKEGLSLRLLVVDSVTDQVEAF